MNTKNNQRFRSMDQKLKATLLELMKTTEFERITVKKICETACVNRSTFYAHYSDIFEIMEQMEEYLSQELLGGYASCALKATKGNAFFPTWLFIPFLYHIKKHSYFYKIVLRQRQEFPLAQVYEPVWTQIITQICQAAGITSEAEIMYHYVYFQAGFKMVMRRWVDTGCQESEEAMARILRHCVPGIWNYNVT